MTRGRIPRITAPAKTDLVLLKVDPFFTTGFSRHMGSPVEDFFANIPSQAGLTGDGRVYSHINIPASSLHKGSTAPTDADIGLFHTLAFDAANDDEAHYTLLIPHRMEAGTGIRVRIDWAYDGAPDAGTVCWNIEHRCIEPGEALVGGAITITETTAGTHTSGQLVRTTFTDQIEGCVAHDAVAIHLFRDISEDTLATDAELIELHLEFIMNKLGEAT